MSLTQHPNYHASRLSLKIIGAVGDPTLFNVQVGASFAKNIVTVMQVIPRTKSLNYMEADKFVSAKLLVDDPFWNTFVSVMGAAMCLDNNLINGKKKEDAINEAACHIQGIVAHQYRMERVTETRHFSYSSVHMNPRLATLIFQYIDDFVKDIGEAA